MLSTIEIARLQLAIRAFFGILFKKVETLIDANIKDKLLMSTSRLYCYKLCVNLNTLLFTLKRNYSSKRLMKNNRFRYFLLA